MTRRRSVLEVVELVVMVMCVFVALAGVVMVGAATSGRQMADGALMFVCGIWARRLHRHGVGQVGPMSQKTYGEALSPSAMCDKRTVGPWWLRPHVPPRRGQ